jgi:lysophospholipase L1-like esterase
MAIAGSATTADLATAGGDGVLVVGDSLAVGTEPPLRQTLGGTDLTVDAQKSRSSGAGLTVLSAAIGPQQGVVVFDLGTNDDPSQPGVLAADLRQARAIAGDRCMVVATLNRPPVAGTSVDGLNRAVRSFAARDPNAELVDWHGAAAADPSLLGADGVHATPSGYAYRAQLFAEAIDACRLGGLEFGDGGEAPAPDLPEASAGRQTKAGPPKARASANRARAAVILAIAREIARGAAR